MLCTNISRAEKNHRLGPVSSPEGNGFLLELSLVVLQNSFAPRHPVAEINSLEVHFRTAAGGKSVLEGNNILRFSFILRDILIIQNAQLLLVVVPFCLGIGLKIRLEMRMKIITSRKFLKWRRDLYEPLFGILFLCCIASGSAAISTTPNTER